VCGSMGPRLESVLPVRHGPSLLFQPMEVAVPQEKFQGILDRIGRLEMRIDKIQSGEYL